MASEKFERRIEVSPAYNHIRPAPHDNYGIGACRIWFYLIGPAGAVQFQIATDWYTESAKRHLAQFPPSPYEREKPEGWDLGYHARAAHYEGQSEMDCQLLGTGKCFYDGSSLNASAMVEAFVNGGTDWLWQYLEKYYCCVFEGGEFPIPVVVLQVHPSERKKEQANG